MKYDKFRYIFINKFGCWKEATEGDRDWEHAKTFKQIGYELWKYKCLMAQIKKEVA